MGYICFFQFWFPQGICLGVGLQGHMVAQFLVCKESSTLFSVVSVSVYIPTDSVGGSLLSTQSPIFIVCEFFDDSHFD